MGWVRFGGGERGHARQATHLLRLGATAPEPKATPRAQQPRRAAHEADSVSPYFLPPKVDADELAAAAPALFAAAPAAGGAKAAKAAAAAAAAAGVSITLQGRWRPWWGDKMALWSGRGPPTWATPRCALDPPLSFDCPRPTPGKKVPRQPSGSSFSHVCRRANVSSLLMWALGCATAFYASWASCADARAARAAEAARRRGLADDKGGGGPGAQGGWSGAQAQ